MRKFLWRPDPPSEKDWPAQLLLAAAKALQPVRPEAMRLDAQIVEVLDQGQLGSCGANALAQALRAGLIRQGTSRTEAALASRLFLYYMARAADGTTDMDAGTYLRSLLDSARRVGYPAERFWPYKPERFALRPNDSAVRAAFDQISGLTYHKLRSHGAQRSFDLRALLAAGYTVIFGTRVSNRFAAYGPESPPLTPPTANETILGGHALLLAGYGPSYFDGVNSHGTAWGRNGWFQMTDAYIEHPSSCDFWILDRVAAFSEV